MVRKRESRSSRRAQLEAPTGELPMIPRTANVRSAAPLTCTFLVPLSTTSIRCTLNILPEGSKRNHIISFASRRQTKVDLPPVTNSPIVRQALASTSPRIVILTSPPVSPIPLAVWPRLRQSRTLTHPPFASHNPHPFHSHRPLRRTPHLPAEGYLHSSWHITAWRNTPTSWIAVTSDCSTPPAHAAPVYTPGLRRFMLEI